MVSSIDPRQEIRTKSSSLNIHPALDPLVQKEIHASAVMPGRGGCIRTYWNEGISCVILYKPRQAGRSEAFDSILQLTKSLAHLVRKVAKSNKTHTKKSYE